MEEIVITSGKKYVDIDAYACAFAVQEFLKLKGIDSKVVFTGVVNHSVTKIIYDLGFVHENTYIDTPNSKYIIVDVSNPDSFENFVELDRVVKIYDHHHGYEEFWNEKLGSNSEIEMIGACATFIYEEFLNNNLLDKISKSVAKLLFIAIISNTLNLKLSITNERDIKAYESLSEIINDQSITKKYFDEIIDYTESNLSNVLENDTKIEKIPQLVLQVQISQIELYNAKSLSTTNIRIL